MEEKSIIIIGAGIAGLSAGCYSQMNGFRTRIFELHDKPGGLCTSWKRQGYTIDGCLHWLVGSAPGIGLYRIWEELGAVQGRRMVDHEEFIRVEAEGDKVFIVHTNIDRLEQHIKELAPQDTGVIEEFVQALRTSTRFDMPVKKAPELYGFLDGLRLTFKMLPFLMAVRKWKKISIHDFAKRFTNPFLREVFPLLFDLPDFPMMGVLLTLAWMHQKVAGYPIGGSLEFSRAIEQRYLNLGGEIQYLSPVRKILVENGRAVGIRLADGTEHRANIIISAADGRATIFDMLDGKYIYKTIQEYYEKLPIFPSLVQVSLGVARSFESVPHSIIYRLREPVVLAGEQRKSLSVEIYNFDPSLAPQGKTVVTVAFASDYEYWERLKQDLVRYDGEKEKLADQVITLLDERFPGLADQVDMCDVATPITWERYTGNWKGSIEGWLITRKTFGMRMSKTLPGLKDFYMAGQWVEPGGGVPTAALSGRNVIQLICKRDGKPFGTKIP